MTRRKRTTAEPWEQVADAIIRQVAAKELEADQAVPWLKALLDYAELEGGNGDSDSANTKQGGGKDG